MSRIDLGKRRSYSENGFVLRYWDVGAGDQLLFLHGAGLPAMSFARIIEQLGGWFRVIVPEIPGFGLSDSPAPTWDFEDYADLVERFIVGRGYRITRLVGYSFGGGIALHLASRLPSLESLLLLSTAGEGVDYRHGGIMVRVLREAWIGMREASRKKTMRIYARIARDFIFNCLRWGLHQHSMMRVLVRCLRRGGSPGPITVPSTVLSVDRDIFFPPRPARGLHAALPAGHKRLLRGTHLWVLIDPLLAERCIAEELRTPRQETGRSR